MPGSIRLLGVSREHSRSDRVMVGVKSRLFRAGLSVLWHSGIARKLGRWTAGKGALLMLHRVQPHRAPTFAPNARLSITPEYLSSLLASLRAAHIDILSLDDALARVARPERTRRFVCFTFDDGYRDNLEHALPIFLHFDAPFTLYVTTSFADRTLTPWWHALEHVLARSDQLRWPVAGRVTCFGARGHAAKQQLFDQLSAYFFDYRAAELSAQLRLFVAANGLSTRELAERDMCSWSELRTLQRAGAEIGCHSVSHPRLALETTQVVRHELRHARERLEAKLGRRVRHLAYPYGRREQVGPREFNIARDLGFASGVTTRQALIFPAHSQHLHALPRIEVTPSFSTSPHYLQTILSGIPVAARNRARFVAA
jgi:peptidoglycan/xylan/chitin deacetylase (PgdA/CDA1 family)